MSLESFLARMAEHPSITLNLPTADPAVWEQLPLVVDDSSYRHRALMGEHTLNLKFSLPDYKKIPIGSYAWYQGERYTLHVPENIQKQSPHRLDYDLVLQSEQYKLSQFVLRNTLPGDRRLKFSYTAKPQEFLKLLVENLNERDEPAEEGTSWEMGTCIEAAEQAISFNHTTCADALRQIAEAFGTEWEIAGKTIHLCKVEHNRENPLPLSYGRGNGLLPGVGRSEYADVKPVERLFVQGGTRNIDPTTYRKTTTTEPDPANDALGQMGSPELLLPVSETIWFDGVCFGDEAGYVAEGAIPYRTDAEGASVMQLAYVDEATGKPHKGLIEGSLDCTEIYPSREGTVGAVELKDAEKNFYDFTDDDPTIPNYTEYLMAGETMTVIFQEGMLAGKEFEVNYVHRTEEGSPARFEIVPQIIDAITMPGGVFVPKTGEKYGVFHCAVPAEYIAEAERNLLKEAVKYLYENEQPRLTFTGTLDPIWASEDWENRSGRLRIGGYIEFRDPQLLGTGPKDFVEIRITALRDYVNNPHKPELELSNNSRPSGSWVHAIQRQVEADEVTSELQYEKAMQYTKRRFQDAKETMTMLQNSMLDFTRGVNPVTVNTMQMLVGDKGLQFKYSQEAHTFRFEPNDEKTFQARAGKLTHNTLKNSDGVPMSWDMPAFRSATLDDPTVGYFVYAKVEKSGASTSERRFMLTETALPMNGDPTYYYLLVGLLNSEFEGDRSFARMYGFTEILPGRITTDLIQSADGKTVFDLEHNHFKMGDGLSWNENGTNQLSVKGTVHATSGRFDGEVNASSGSFNGHINATSGQIGGFILEDNRLRSVSNMPNGSSIELWGKNAPAGADDELSGAIRMHSAVEGRGLMIDTTKPELKIFNGYRVCGQLLWYEGKDARGNDVREAQLRLRDPVNNTLSYLSSNQLQLMNHASGGTTAAFTVEAISNGNYLWVRLLGLPLMNAATAAANLGSGYLYRDVNNFVKIVP